MKIEELRGKTKDELGTLLLNLKKESFNLRFQKASGELEKTSRMREVKRTVARIKTLLNNSAELEKAAPAKKKQAKKTKSKAA